MSLSALTDYASGSAHSVGLTPEGAISWTPQDDATFHVILNCVAMRTDSNDARAAFSQEFCVTRIGGTTSIVASGTQNKMGNLAAATWSLSTSIVSNALVVIVMGGLSQTVDWNVCLYGSQVGPF